METTEDILKLLKELGVAPGTWTEISAHMAQLDTMKRQAEILSKLKAFLEGMVAQDQAKVADLKEQLAKLKFGGGA